MRVPSHTPHQGCLSFAHAAPQLVTAWVVVVGLAGALGCGAGRAARGDVKTVVNGFARALEEHRFEAAYGMMDDAYRARVSLETFVTGLESNAEETAALADSLAGAGANAERRATVVYAPGNTPPGRLELRYGSGRWAIATDVATFYDQSTPRAALQSFVRAVRTKRYDVVMRLLPDENKAGVTAERMHETWTGEGRAEVERIIEHLGAHLDAPIEVIGGRATMPYGQGQRVQFVRENGRWKIEEPE